MGGVFAGGGTVLHAIASRMAADAVAPQASESRRETRVIQVFTLVHARSSARSCVAAATRSATMCTPIPAPVGTAMVPSAATVISGSIRSGAKYLRLAATSPGNEKFGSVDK